MYNYSIRALLEPNINKGKYLDTGTEQPARLGFSSTGIKSTIINYLCVSLLRAQLSKLAIMPFSIESLS